jgi:hypothetical protein
MAGRDFLPDVYFTLLAAGCVEPIWYEKISLSP